MNIKLLKNTLYNEIIEDFNKNKDSYMFYLSPLIFKLKTKNFNNYNYSLFSKIKTKELITFKNYKIKKYLKKDYENDLKTIIKIIFKSNYIDNNNKYALYYIKKILTRKTKLCYINLIYRLLTNINKKTGGIGNFRSNVSDIASKLTSKLTSRISNIASKLISNSSKLEKERDLETISKFDIENQKTNLETIPNLNIENQETDLKKETNLNIKNQEINLNIENQETDLEKKITEIIYNKSIIESNDVINLLNKIVNNRSIESSSSSLLLLNIDTFEKDNIKSNILKFAKNFDNRFDFILVIFTIYFCIIIQKYSDLISNSNNSIKSIEDKIVSYITYFKKNILSSLNSLINDDTINEITYNIFIYYIYAFILYNKLKNINELQSSRNNDISQFKEFQEDIFNIITIKSNIIEFINYFQLNYYVNSRHINRVKLPPPPYIYDNLLNQTEYIKLSIFYYFLIDKFLLFDENIITNYNLNITYIKYIYIFNMYIYFKKIRDIIHNKSDKIIDNIDYVIDKLINLSTNLNKSGGMNMQLHNDKLELLLSHIFKHIKIIEY